MCVCFLCFLPIYAGHQVRWMYQPAGVTQEEGHTGFPIHLPSAVRALSFLARRIQPFPSLVDREVEFLFTNDFHRSPLFGYFYFYFILFFTEQKSRLPGFELTSQREVTCLLLLSYRGDRLLPLFFEKPARHKGAILQFSHFLVKNRPHLEERPSPVTSMKWSV